MHKKKTTLSFLFSSSSCLTDKSQFPPTKNGMVVQKSPKAPAISHESTKIEKLLSSSKIKTATRAQSITNRAPEQIAKRVEG